MYPIGTMGKHKRRKLSKQCYLKARATTQAGGGEEVHLASGLLFPRRAALDALFITRAFQDSVDEKYQAYESDREQVRRDRRVSSTSAIT